MIQIKMTTIHVRLRKGINKIRLQQNPLVTMMIREMNILRCVVAWSLKNVREDINDKIVVDSVEKTIPEGYYSFSDLKTELKKHNVTIEKLLDNHITINCDKDVNLQKLGSSLLGFDEESLVKNTTHTSRYSASLTNKIKDIHVYCSLVDSSRNFSYNLLNTSLYNASTQLLVIPIDTTQQLNGNFTEYNANSSVPCRDDITTQEIIFVVESGGHEFDYEIFLTISMK